MSFAVCDKCGLDDCDNCVEDMVDYECLSCGNEFPVEKSTHDDITTYMECDCGEHMTPKGLEK